MDKIITINLGGYAIKMEEDAYEALKPYIRQIEETFANTENGKEIINDIEARIAEMLMERTEGKVSATIADVEFVKKAMGNPGEFEDSENRDSDQSGTKEKTKQSSIPHDTVRKRLYRDTDNKVFGGVCSGIANFFNIDPVIVRLIWVFLFFVMGIGFLLYFIMWVIVPEAITTAQKLEMRGEAPTLDNIINRVKSEAGKVEQNLKAQNFGQKIGDIFSNLSPIFKIIFKGIALFIGFIILLILSGTLIALITSNSSFVFNHNDVIIHHIPNFFDAGWEFLTFKILVGLFISIPLFTILTGLLKFGFSTHVNYQPIRKVLGWIWVATIPMLIYFIYLGVQNFRSYETITSEKTEVLTAPLIIKSNFNDDDYFMECIDVTISPSDDSLVHITTTQSANGKNSAQARDQAEKNGATYTFSGNELTLKTGDYYAKTGLFRGQKVEFDIQIPNGKSFTLDKSIQKMGVDVEGQNITYYADETKEKPKALLFLNSNLFCPSCPDSIPLGSSGLHNYSNFTRIEARGNVEVEIRNGAPY
ncbi:MAG: PspC domain-containing protein, partial [Bacteroidia bacterium]